MLNLIGAMQEAEDREVHDCKNDVANKRQEGKPNNTTPYTTPSPSSNCEPSATDQPGYADQKCKLPLPIAHIIGKGGDLDVKWEYSRRSEAISEHMGFENGSLVIRVTGFYYVYSQVAFVGANCTEDSLVLESKFLSKAPNYGMNPVELMEVTESVCESTKAKLKWHRSLRQGGVFHFEENTHLFVKISPRDKAEMEHHKTYFGAFKLQ
ncbi:tumor necrosis factor ligand superfamily member 10-like [Carcharodon carcharias]|uniref:TNF superfamily member 33 n=1 Tax=Carcharodon carcharias TaxID=13397 RepID=UPI001B7E5139|nr:TNF superfamily member 33 [Carcharodon carcharias]